MPTSLTPTEMGAAIVAALVTIGGVLKGAQISVRREPDAEKAANAPLLLIDPRRADLAIQELGAVQVALTETAKVYQQASRDIIAGVGVDGRVKSDLIEAMRVNTEALRLSGEALRISAEAVRINSDVCNRMLRSVDEARNEIRDMTTELVRSSRAR